VIRTGKLRGLLLGFLVILACSLMHFSPAQAANPTTISFQGKVVNANGTNVTDGSYSFLFKLYTVASSGTAVWTETQSSVTVTSGVFQVNLGSVCPFFTANTCNNNTPIDFNANPALYLGITFNGDAAGEMTPRVQLQSVPYAYNADKLNGIAAAGFAQLQTGAVTQQTGAVSISGNLTSAAIVQAATVTATGALQGATLSVDGGAFAVNSSGAIAASTGITSTGIVNVQSSAYTTSLALINDGQTTAPPTYPATPASIAPAFTVITSETSGSRPLFFGYNTGSNAYAAFLTSGACGAFTQMCLDLGSGTSYNTALENVGTNLEVGGGDDSSFASTTLMSATTNVAGNIVFTAAAAGSITGSTNQSLTIQSSGTGALTLNSASGTLSLNPTTNTLQRVTSGTNTTTSIDLDDTDPTTTNTLLVLKNSGTGVANLDLYGGALQTGVTPVTRLDNVGDLTNIANYTSTGGVTGGFVNDAHTETANGTFAYTEATEALGYYLSDTSYSGTAGVAPTSATTTFTVSGLPNTVDGTEAFFTINDTKPAATNGVTATVHTVVLVIGTQTIATLAGASGEGAVTETRSFIVMRMNGTWRIVGEPATTAVANTTSTATTADYAEYIDYAGTDKPQPGDVISASQQAVSVQKSMGAYDSTALGVVSTTPYQVGGADDGHSVILALTGRVPVNVSLENGPIEAGDPLTASSIPGVAMKATKAGHIIGTALSSYDGSQPNAQVTVQLDVGFDDPTGASDVISSQAIASGLDIDSGPTADVGLSQTIDDSLDASPTTTTADGAITITNPNSNATNLDNGNLNLANASLSGGLQVGGDATFAGLTTFQKLATFIARVVFKQDVEIDGHLTVGTDTAGYASLRPGEISVHINFARAYDSVPIVSANVTTGQFDVTTVTNVTPNGFDISLASPAITATGFSWTAIAVNNPQTATNPEVQASDQTVPADSPVTVPATASNQ
jgi:hypothetical protein